MRVSYIGNTPAFQAGKVGSIPTTRSIKQLILVVFLFLYKSIKYSIVENLYILTTLIVVVYIIEVSSYYIFKLNLLIKWLYTNDIFIKILLQYWQIYFM